MFLLTFNATQSPIALTGCETAIGACEIIGDETTDDAKIGACGAYPLDITGDETARPLETTPPETFTDFSEKKN